VLTPTEPESAHFPDAVHPELADTWPVFTSAWYEDWKWKVGHTFFEASERVRARASGFRSFAIRHAVRNWPGTWTESELRHMTQKT
jgi:hypothetical protein